MDCRTHLNLINDNNALSSFDSRLRLLFGGGLFQVEMVDRLTTLNLINDNGALTSSKCRLRPATSPSDMPAQNGRLPDNSHLHKILCSVAILSSSAQVYNSNLRSYKQSNVHDFIQSRYIHSLGYHKPETRPPSANAKPQAAVVTSRSFPIRHTSDPHPPHRH